MQYNSGAEPRRLYVRNIAELAFNGENIYEDSGMHMNQLQETNLKRGAFPGITRQSTVRNTLKTAEGRTNSCKSTNPGRPKLTAPAARR